MTRSISAHSSPLPLNCVGPTVYRTRTWSELTPNDRKSPKVFGRAGNRIQVAGSRGGSQRESRASCVSGMVELDSNRPGFDRVAFSCPLPNMRKLE